MAVFILNDETVKNSHGFYLLNGGGDFKRFEANPVMLDCHDLTKLLGRWRGREIKDSQLIAEAEFDLGDVDAAKRAGQVERGFLNGASVGIIILEAEYRFNPATETDDLYVTKWELFEASIVTIPSNSGALTLKIYDATTSIAIADELIHTHVAEIVKLSLQINNIENMTKPISTLTPDALTALEVTENATPAELSVAIVALKTADTNKGAQIAELQMKIEAGQDKKNAEMVSLAIIEGRVQESQRAALLEFAKTNPEACATMLSGKPAKPSINDSIFKIDLNGDRKDWTFFDWKNKDTEGLAALKINSPDEYSQITKKLK